MKNLLDCKNEVARQYGYADYLQIDALEIEEYEKDAIKVSILESVLASQFKASPSSEKPDFEEMADKAFADTKGYLGAGYEAGCATIWNLHALPLQKENEQKQYTIDHILKCNDDHKDEIQRLKNLLSEKESSLKSEKELNLNLIQTIGEKEKEIEELKQSMNWAIDSLESYADGGDSSHVKDAKNILKEAIQK